MQRPPKPQYSTIVEGKLTPERAKACLAYATFRTKQIADGLRARLTEFENETLYRRVTDLRRDLDKSYAHWITDVALYVTVRTFYDEDGNFRKSP